MSARCDVAAQRHEVGAGLAEGVRSGHRMAGRRCRDLVDVRIGTRAVVVPFGAHHHAGAGRDLHLADELDRLAGGHVGALAAVHREPDDRMHAQALSGRGRHLDLAVHDAVAGLGRRLDPSFGPRRHVAVPSTNRSDAQHLTSASTGGPCCSGSVEARRFRLPQLEPVALWVANPAEAPVPVLLDFVVDRRARCSELGLYRVEITDSGVDHRGHRSASGRRLRTAAARPEGYCRRPCRDLVGRSCASRFACPCSAPPS